jgi:hypothetical protein
MDEVSNSAQLIDCSPNLLRWILALDNGDLFSLARCRMAMFWKI